MAQNLDYFGMFDYEAGDTDIYEYTSEEFSTLIKGLTGNGVSKNYLNGFEAYATNLTVTIDTGAFFIDGRFGVNEYAKTITLTSTPSSTVRYDRIVGVLDYANRTMAIDVLTGTSAAKPSIEPTSTKTYIPLWAATVNGSSVALNDERVFTYSAANLQQELNDIVESFGDVLPISKGGTGATSATQAIYNLGIAPSTIGAAAASHNHDISQITSLSTKLAAKADASHTHKLSDLDGSLPLTKGGTGATTFSAARTNLGIVVDTDEANITNPYEGLILIKITN